MEWKKVSRNDNYSINESGQVRNDATGRILKPFVNKANGYPTVSLWRNNKSDNQTVHRLLAEAFIPNPDNKPTIDHIDGNRTHNSLDNLRWATYSENNTRFGTRGVRSQRITVLHYDELRRKRGGGHEKWLDVIEVFQFNSITETAKHFDVTIGNISLMLKSGGIGRRGKMRGYQFIYEKGHRYTYSSANV